ncbi:MAG: DegT/DnrJ/EryC1/StrS family aminotransferase, partial [Polyangiaceae bacterium]|nr:DegT/DnrJ/EryC1/StrS family aminotransferase [Polyangiaceae bacterium]
AAVARDGRFVLGPRVEAFERWLADASGVGHAVGVASGTDAIELALRALGVGEGDAVVTPAFSFVAAAEAIASAGARPVFCDVDPRTMNADAQTMAAAVDRARGAGLRVRALLPVHLFGRAAPVEALRDLSLREGIALVEDAAQAFGARTAAGAPAGGSGDAGCFSFFPTKNLGAWGDGGAVVTPHADVAARVRKLRAHGAVAPYVHAEVGRNSRLDAMQAAVLTVKARHVEAWQRARAAWADRYTRAFAHLPLGLPAVPERPAVHAWHAFVVRTPRRDALAESLHAAGIETRVYYPVPLHRQRAFARFGQEPDMPVAESLCQTALALPISALPAAAAQELVIERVEAFFAGR